MSVFATVLLVSLAANAVLLISHFSKSAVINAVKVEVGKVEVSYSTAATDLKTFIARIKAVL